MTATQESLSLQQDDAKALLALPESTIHPVPSTLGLYRCNSPRSFSPGHIQDSDVVAGLRHALGERFRASGKWYQAGCMAEFIAPYNPARASFVRGCGWDGDVTVKAGRPELQRWYCHDRYACPNCREHFAFRVAHACIDDARRFQREGVPVRLITIIPPLSQSPHNTPQWTPEEASDPSTPAHRPTMTLDELLASLPPVPLTPTETLAEVKRITNILYNTLLKRRNGPWCAAVAGIDAKVTELGHVNLHLHILAFGAEVSPEDLWQLLWPNSPFDGPARFRISVDKVGGEVEDLRRTLTYVAKCGPFPEAMTPECLAEWARLLFEHAGTRYFRRWKIGKPVRERTSQVSKPGSPEWEPDIPISGVQLSQLITRANSGDSGAISLVDTLTRQLRAPVRTALDSTGSSSPVDSTALSTRF